MKYAVVLQQNEADCGAACLGAIAKHYGQSISLTRLRAVVGTGQQGTTLLGLQQGADALGFNARPVRAAPEVLDRVSEVPLPTILHWQGNHWVVWHGKRNQHYVIADPAVGIRFLTAAEVRAGWLDWAMLLLEPDPARFAPIEGSDRPPLLGQFLQRIWSYRTLLAEVLLLNLVVGLLSIAMPFLIQVLTDDVLVRGDLRLLNQVAIAVIVLTLFSNGLSWVQANLTAYFAQRLELSLVLEFGRALLRLPLSYYETHRSGEVVSRLQDIQALNQLISQVVVSLPSQVFIAIASLGFMSLLSGPLTLAAIGLAVLMTLSTVVFLPTLQQRTRTLILLDADNQGVLVETFKGALTLKTTTAETQFWDEVQSRFGRLANLNFRTNQIGIVNGVFSNLVAGIGSVGILWFGSTLVIRQELSIGQLLAFTSLNLNFTNLISTVVRFVDEFARVRTAAERLTEVINHPSELNELAKPAVTLPPNAPIECAQVSFHYPGRVELLNDFSVTIPGGCAVALVGKSGCGKSTLAKLIAGLYTPQSGNIRIGPYNLLDLSLESLRQQVVLVPQMSHFWGRSLLENFRLGHPHIPFEAIVQACQTTGADEFISRLPDKYQTVLGEFGANLSGGQQQRLAIARALMHNPAILILDESTANLDPESEADLLDKLLQQRQGKTTILISHRSQVIRRADWLILLDQGKLVERKPMPDLNHNPKIYGTFLSN
ncbi:MAG: peptidase domain-containing ABC transporter [Leptolyngbyaceae cyanobacterium bins.349]|nr:peptidase domain-containing ABC transporter [Leptolyngbyaceae cyanobacterium bins.349]